MSAESYLAQFVALLPPGRIWPAEQSSTLQGLLLALGARLDAVDQRIEEFLIDVHPTTTTEMVDWWESFLGLPDDCTPAAQTMQERVARILQRLTVRPRPTLAYLQEIAIALGYTAEITETGPYELTVNIPTPAVVYFRTGASRCGDLLGKINRATDLECVLAEEKPAHLTLIFNYSGV